MSKDDPTKMIRVMMVPITPTGDFVVVKTVNFLSVKYGLFGIPIGGIDIAHIERDLPLFIPPLYDTIQRMSKVSNAHEFKVTGIQVSETSATGGKMIFVYCSLTPEQTVAIQRITPARSIIAVSRETLMEMYTLETTRMKYRGYTTCFHADLIHFGRLLDKPSFNPLSKSNDVFKYKVCSSIKAH